VLDSFMGGGSTAEACARMNRKFIGIEIDSQWFDLSCKRIEQAYAQPDMFIAPPKKQEQDTLL